MGGSYPFNLGRGGAALKDMKTYMDEVWANLGGGSTQGTTRYVDGTNGNDASTGLSWAQAHLTLADAVGASSAGDTILIAPGTYTLTAVLTPLARMRFKADVRGPIPTVTIAGNIANVVEVDVDGVSFEGIRFQASGATADNLIDVADAAAVSGLRFVNCWFDGNSQTTVDGINAVDATFALSALEVFNCRFLGGLVNGIDIGALGMADSRILHNIFLLELAAGTSRAVNMADTTAFATGFGWEIAYNTVMGPPDGGADAFPYPAGAAEESTGGGFIHDNVERHTLNALTNKVWYVDATAGLDNNPGDDPQLPFLTLARARARSAAGDEIVIGPGTYTVDLSVAAFAPKANQYWHAKYPSAVPNVIIEEDGVDDTAGAMTAVDVDGVKFEGIRFRLAAGSATHLVLVSAAQTNAVAGLTFKNCWFDLNDIDVISIACQFDDATNALTGLVMKDCRFTGTGGATAVSKGIVVGVGGIPTAYIADNIFEVNGAGAQSFAIDFLDPTAANKSYGVVILRNGFIGPGDGGADGVLIRFAGAMTEDEIVGLIADNFFGQALVTPITQDKVNGSIVQNFVGDDATGGTLIDPGT